MKILTILFLTLSLQATCNQEEFEHSKRLFFEANQESNVSKQINLLERSLQSCFSFEVEFSLLTLKVDASQSQEERLKFYDQMLETLSQIRGNDALVLSEQSRINNIIGEMYQKENPLLSDIYRKKADAQNEVENKEEKNYLLWILFGVALLLWASWDLLKKWGKF